MDPRESRSATEIEATDSRGSDPAADVFGPRTKKKKRVSSKLAENHADMLIALMFPKSPVAKAGKQIAWIFRGRPNPCRACGMLPRVPITRAEDLYSAFDRIVTSAHKTVHIQATVLGAPGSGGGTTAARRAKVRQNFIAPLRESMGEAAEDLNYLTNTVAPRLAVEVWAWELRRGMHVWSYQWADDRWYYEPMIWSVKRGALHGEKR